jgi:hypothetical protein
MDAKPLTAEQFVRFRRGHRRLLKGLGLVVGYCLALGLVDELIPLERFGFWIALGMFPVTAVLIWCMHGFRCPACGAVPRARVWSFWSGEVAYSSMVALWPKACSECGVEFSAPLEATSVSAKNDGPGARF